MLLLLLLLPLLFFIVSLSLSLKFGSVHGQASEMAIADSGYVAPEHDQSSSGNSKADVYAFGVLLLEIVTGRKPFDKYTLISVQPLFYYNFPLLLSLIVHYSLSLSLSPVHEHRESSHW